MSLNKCIWTYCGSYFCKRVSASKTAHSFKILFLIVAGSAIIILARVEQMNRPKKDKQSLKRNKYRRKTREECHFERSNESEKAVVDSVPAVRSSEMGNELLKWALQTVPGLCLPFKWLLPPFTLLSLENEWLERRVMDLDHRLWGRDANRARGTRPWGGMITRAICHNKCQCRVPGPHPQVFWHTHLAPCSFPGWLCLTRKGWSAWVDWDFKGAYISSESHISFVYYIQVYLCMFSSFLK